MLRCSNCKKPKTVHGLASYDGGKVLLCVDCLPKPKRRRKKKKRK